MRLLPSFLLLVLTLSSRLSAQNADLPTRNGIIPDQALVQPVRKPAIDLRNYFQVTGITGQVVQFNTPGASVFNVEMNAAAAPNTVTNFLAYVNAGRFTNSFIHRSDPGTGIIQGGTFLRSVDSSGHINSVSTSAPINLETSDSLPNAAGTIAMARTTDPNSATGGWFINVINNSASLPPASAGGYAAFGRVTGTGMTVVNAIAALPVLGGKVTVTGSSTGNAAVFVDSATSPANFGPGWVLLGATVQNVIGNLVTLDANADRTITTNTLVPYTYFSATAVPASNNNALTQLPVFTNLGSASASLLLSNLVTQSSITTIPVFPTTPTGPSVITFSALSSNPGLVRATISGSNLYVAAAANLNGSATITVTATDTNGNAVSQTPYNVTVTRKVMDYNNDSIGDLIFQNNAGQIAVWYLSAAGTYASSAYVSASALGDWKVVGTADMNGDGIADLLFQNNAGQIAVWYMNASGSYTSTAYISTTGLGDWRVVAPADMNSDGNTDLIFQNNAGQFSIWYMNGLGSYTGTAYFSTAGLGDWRLKCAADINGDGIADLIFQNNAGQVAVWYINAAGAFVSSAYISTGGLGDWKLASASDINGDGIADLLFQNNAGQIAVWRMNGSGSYTSNSYLYSAGLGDWRLH